MPDVLGDSPGTTKASFRSRQYPRVSWAEETGQARAKMAAAALSIELLVRKTAPKASKGLGLAWASARRNPPDRMSRARSPILPNDVFKARKDRRRA